MDWATSEMLQFLTLLFPRFDSAWIFYALTSYPKPSEFERVVQARIFTVLIRGIVVLTPEQTRSYLPQDGYDQESDQ